MFEKPDYSVEHVHLTYDADMLMEQSEIEDISDFWKSESYTWDDIGQGYYWDVTRDFKESDGMVLAEIFASKPQNVRNIVYTIKYSYNGNTYKYVSKSDFVVWPPHGTSSGVMSFKMPIVSAWCLNSDGIRIRNVTNKLKKAAGPKNNFHNQDVKIMDVIDYDYPQVEVTTIIGTRIVSENDSVLDI